MQIIDAYDYLIHLIYCAIHETSPEPLPEGVTFEDVLSCAIMHDIAGFAYLGVIRSEEKPDEETLNRWQQRYFLGIKRNAEQENARQRLLEAFHGQGIATLELQGTRVKQYYPSPDLRMMGDIDILVERKNISTAEKLLSDLGYTVKGADEYEVDAENGDIEIEIHTEHFLFHRELKNILPQPFQNATVNADFTATVPDTEFWAYHLLHCLKHYQSNGIGIRRILDLYFIRPQMEKTADNEYVNGILEKNGFLERMKDLFAVADLWFGGKETDRNINDVVTLIKLSGTQGNVNVNIRTHLDRMNDEGKRFIKLRYIMSWLFLSKESIYRAYPLCKKRHYPYVLCQLHRLIRLPFKQGRWKFLIELIVETGKTKVK